MKNTSKNTLDRIFSEFIRRRDADKDGYVRCYCCNYPVHWESAQAMHFCNRRHLNTRWFEKNVHGGCISCNMYNGGNLEAYERHLKKDYGESIVEVLTIMKNTYMKYSDDEMEGMIIHYKNEVKRLRKEKGL